LIYSYVLIEQLWDSCIRDRIIVVLIYPCVIM
jgi:hypothetical protein